MRKFIALFMLAGILFVPAFANAQDAPADSAAATEATPAAEETAASPTVVDDEIVAEEQSFHQLIKGSVTTGENNKRTRDLYQHDLADEEVTDVDPLIEVGVGVLLHREHDVAAHRAAADILGTAISRFHETGSTPGHDGESQFGNFSGQLSRQSIIGAGLGETRRAEHCHARP